MGIAPDADISLALRERDRALELLDRFYLSHHGSAILWVAAPVLRAQYLLLSPVPIRARLPWGRLAAERLGNHVYAAYRPSNSTHTLAGRAMFCVDTFSDLWPIDPIIERARRAGGPSEPATARARPRTLARHNREAADLAGRFVDEIVAEGIHAPCPPVWVYRHFLGAARYLAHAEALLEGHETDVVVVGTNHNKAARALLDTAHRRGIASVYVPHAPMVRDLRVADLPVQYAALRGGGEAEVYGRLGVDPDALATVGNPGLSVPPDRVPDPEGRIAFALPPLSLRQMREVVALVHEAAGDDVIVTPHPSQSRDEVRQLCPDPWEIWEGRTYDYLAADRPPAFIQHSSGVSLESILLGVPTIQLSVEGWSTNYMVIDSGHMPFAATSDDLQAALAAARSIGVDAERRRSLVEWGRHWCEFDGDAAADRGWALVERAAIEPRPALAWDAWADVEATRERERSLATFDEDQNQSGLL